MAVLVGRTTSIVPLTAGLSIRSRWPPGNAPVQPPQLPALMETSPMQALARAAACAVVPHATATTLVLRLGQITNALFNEVGGQYRRSR
jgi:hypothetical protein